VAARKRSKRPGLARERAAVEGLAAPELERLARAYIDDSPRLAARALRRALQLRPGDGALMNNLGVALWNLGDRGEALAAFERARERLPDDRNVVENVAAACLDLRRPEEARRLFRTAARLRRGRRTLLAYVDPHGY
jgi:tetratricopeptide (TPR) repeat protein